MRLVWTEIVRAYVWCQIALEGHYWRRRYVELSRKHIALEEALRNVSHMQRRGK